MGKGLDISHHQGVIDFKKVKKAGISFIIPRDGWGPDNIDTRFIEYVKNAKAAGIEIPGVYHFIYAVNVAEVKKNAKKAIANVKAAGLPKTTVIWCDLEYDTVDNAKKRGVNLTAAMQKKFIETFCDYVLSKGYPTGAYVNQDYLNRVVGTDFGKKYDLWLADLEGAAACRCVYRQTGWYGQINGISGNVDTDEYYGQYTAGTATATTVAKKEAGMTRAEKIEAVCKAAVKIANDDSHGYSNVVGDNTGANGDYDCGGFVSECLKQAGILKAGQVFEPNERYGNPWSYGTVLEPAGFVRMAFSKPAVQRGDILIKDGHHTELALGNGRQIGAHSNYDGRRGDYSHLGEISEVALSGYWDYIYRLKDDGSKPVETKSVSYQSYDMILNKWLPKVTSTAVVEDTAGLPNHPMGALAVTPSAGAIRVYVHDKGAKKWRKGIVKCDVKKGIYAGGLKSIDGVAIKCSKKIKVAYRVKLMKYQTWLPWVYSKDFKLKDADKGFAGILGFVIDEIEIKII